MLDFMFGSNKSDEQSEQSKPSLFSFGSNPPPTPEGGQPIPGRPQSQSQEPVTPPTSGWFKSLFPSKQPAVPVAEPVAAEPVAAAAAGGRRRRRK